MNTPTSETVYLSKRGMKDLKKETAQLERTIHQATLELHDMDKSDSREERFERIERLARIEALEVELAEKRTQLDHAKLLPRRRDALKVAIGSVVDLLDSNGRIVRYTLVDSIEADPSDGRISIKSPLGKSLIGRAAKENVSWSAGMRTNSMRLVRIN